MKSKLKFLFVGVVLMGVMSAGSANAAITNGTPVKGDWFWSGVGKTIEFGVISGEPNYTFGLSSMDNSDGMTLLTSAISYANSTVYSNTDANGVTQYFATTGSGVSTKVIGLGETADYKFWFDDGSGPTSIYSIVTYNQTDYFLSSSDDLVSVYVHSPNATPSAVPIPGSALLLASSLLGLIGIGSRKNKA